MKKREKPLAQPSSHCLKRASSQDISETASQCLTKTSSSSRTSNSHSSSKRSFSKAATTGRSSVSSCYPSCTNKNRFTNKGRGVPWCSLHIVFQPTKNKIFEKNPLPVFFALEVNTLDWKTKFLIDVISLCNERDKLVSNFSSVLLCFSAFVFSASSRWFLHSTSTVDCVHCVWPLLWQTPDLLPCDRI